MEAGDEFLVIDNEKDGEMEIKNVVDLFYSSIDALNQSTVLLRDELQNALSSALRRLKPDDGSSTEEILKSFNRSVTSTEDVRKDYIKRLCTRLVTIEAEKQALMTECAQLKAGSWLSEQNDEITELEKLVCDISRSVRLLEKDAGISNTPGSIPSKQGSSTLSLLTLRLADIRDRLSNLPSLKIEKSSNTIVEDSDPNTDTTEENNGKVRSTARASGDAHLNAKAAVKENKKNQTSKTAATEHRKFRRKVEQVLGLADKSVTFDDETAKDSASEASDCESVASTQDKLNTGRCNFQKKPEQPVPFLDAFFAPAPQMPLSGSFSQFPNCNGRFLRPMFGGGVFPDDPRNHPRYIIVPGNPMHSSNLFPPRGSFRPPYRRFYYQRRRSASKSRRFSDNNQKDSTPESTTGKPPPAY